MPPDVLAILQAALPSGTRRPGRHARVPLRAHRARLHDRRRADGRCRTDASDPCAGDDLRRDRAAEPTRRHLRVRRSALSDGVRGGTRRHGTGQPERTLRGSSTARCASWSVTRAEQLCAMRYESIVHPDAHDRIIETLQTMIDVETPTWTSEGRLIHADGHIVWVSQSTTVVRDSAGTAQPLPRPLSGHHRPQAVRQPAESISPSTTR